MYKPTDIECLYIDFDAFFAHVEKQLDPASRPYPMGVTSLASENATLITCCYIAKAAGVTRGMRVFEARELCPDIIIKPARHDVYVDYHNRILKEVGQHVPITKVWSVDEVECTLIGQERHSAKALAERIRAGLERSIGACITPSIGLGPNQFLAKVAAEMNKPSGLTVLHPSHLPGPLLELSLRDLPGISKGMETRLNRAGITSVNGLWNTSAKQARALWGNVEGERMWAQLRGYAVARPGTTRRMFGHSRILSGDWQHPDKALECLRLLTVKAAYRMRREGYTAGSMFISFKTDHGRINRQTSFAACADDRNVAVHMGRLYSEGLLYAGHPPRIRSVSVMLFDIIKAGERTGDMFHDTKANPVNHKWCHLTKMMDGLNEKHGACVVHLGPRAKIPGGYAGAKIAFGRVPDAGDFY